MGRQQYLTRLVLGRSAYEEVPLGNLQQSTNVHNINDEASATIANNEDANDFNHQASYVQQRDEKGRPINPATEARNAAVRRAQNDVYALIGVVEKKDNEDASRQHEHVLKRENRAGVLMRDNDSVDALEFLTRLLVILPQCWLRNFLMRILVGSYHHEASFLTIVRMYSTRPMPGWRGIYALICPGAAAQCLYILLREVLNAVTEEIVSRLQTAVLRSDLPRSKIRSIHSHLEATSRILTTATAIGLLPLKEWYILQELGVASPLIWLPPLAASLPSWTSPASFHRHLWRSPFPRVPVLGVIGSSACLLLVRELLWNRFEADEDSPLFSTLTDLRFPKINDPQTPPTLADDTLAQPRTFWKDPFGYFLRPIATARQHMLRYLGWTLHNNTTGLFLPDFENNIQLATNSNDLEETHNPSAEGLEHPDLARVGKVRVYRSTALAHFPAELLAKMTDRFLCRMVMLPLESFMLRNIVYTWLSTVQNPRSTSSLDTLPNGESFYPPYRGNLLGMLFAKGDGNPELAVAASYLSKVGLALAMDATLIVGTFGISSWAAGWLGQNAFRWGSLRF